MTSSSTSCGSVHAAVSAQTRSVIRQLQVTILTACLIAGAGCDQRGADKHFHGDALRLDGRYHREIHFTALGVRIPLPPKAYVRVDSPVAETADHVRLLLRELGVTATNISYTNPAKHGGQLHLRFRDGKECSFIWARRDADSRLTRMRLEHEKYHAVCRLVPEAIASLCTRIAALGFDVNLSAYDEEFAATLIEILTLHLERVPLKDIHGSDLVEQAVQLLEGARATSDHPAPYSISDAEDWH